MMLQLLTPSGKERRIEQGDLVIVYERFDSMKAVRVSAKDTFQNRFGAFPMKVTCIHLKNKR